ATRGRVTGFLLGGALGAAFGDAMGASVRSTRVSGYGESYTTSEGHGGLGVLLGVAALGGLGAWWGGRLGERQAHEVPWYVAASPAVPPAGTAGPPATIAAVPESSQAATDS